MESASCIEQKGVIERIDNGLAEVNITNFSACAHCQSKSACGVIDTETRSIQVPVAENSFSKGELVNIIMRRSLGLRAAFFAYIIPFVLVIATLLTLTTLQLSELLTGLLSLSLLIPYFLSLYLFRDRLKRTFTFTLRKAV